METKQDLEQLKTLAKDDKSGDRGARLRRALLTLAIPAAAALATACYGAPMAQEPTTAEPAAQTNSVDCDGDGVADAPSTEACQE